MNIVGWAYLNFTLNAAHVTLPCRIPLAGRFALPAIALTAYASDRDRQDALEAGYFEHIAKPVQPYHLARTIVRAVRPPS
jgi:CheY-like chemotaxis protein